MAVVMIDRADPRFKVPTDVEVRPDRLERDRIMHRRKKDEREDFVTEEVTIQVGPKAAPAVLKLRWPKSAEIIEEKDDLDNVVARTRVWTNGRYIFAVYADNPEWHKATREEWEGAAKNAIEKFCAIRGASIIFGPRQEDTNRYNIMVEVRDPIAEPQ